MATNRDAFDRIAESWYRVRHWPLLREELEQLAERWSGTGQPAQRWSEGRKLAQRWWGSRQAAERWSGGEQATERWSGGRLLNIGCAHGADFLPFQRNSGPRAPHSYPKIPKRIQEYSATFGPRGVDSSGKTLETVQADSSQSELQGMAPSRKTREEAPEQDTTFELGGTGSSAKIVEEAPPHSAKFELWGMDFAPRMLEQAQRYSAKFGFYVNLVVGDMLALPYGDSTFDFAIAVAAYHHIQGRKHRATAVKELARVLKPEGEAFLSVWNRAQPRFWLRSREQLVPWRLVGKTVHRYYHLFTHGEMRRLLVEAGFDIIYLGPEKSYRFPLRTFFRNICAIVRKHC
jgi:tRNA (uracil-5-)-methyltransferase TRM9